MPDGTRGDQDNIEQTGVQTLRGNVTGKIVQHYHYIGWRAIAIVLAAVAVGLSFYFLSRSADSASKNVGGGKMARPRGSPVIGQAPADLPCSELASAKACFDPDRGVFWVKDRPPGDTDHAAVYWSSQTGPLHGQCHNMDGSHGPWVTCSFAEILAHHQREVAFYAAVVNGRQIVDRGPVVTIPATRQPNPTP